MSSLRRWELELAEWIVITILLIKNRAAGAALFFDYFILSWWAVAFIEIYSILLKAGMLAGSHLRSMRRFVTDRVSWRAVGFIEIYSDLLKARMTAGSHLKSKRRFVTAHVSWWAVAFAETTSVLLKTKI